MGIFFDGGRSPAEAGTIVDMYLGVFRRSIFLPLVAAASSPNLGLRPHV